jgi:transcriptional regulator with XRE-family HTH domain
MNTSAEPGRSAHADADSTIAQVGARIRSMRLRRGLTLKDVSEATGLSVSMLSMLERGVSSASVGTLVSVASALGVHMRDLFDGTVTEGSPVVRVADQTSVTTTEGTTRRVAHNDTQAGMEMSVNEYPPGTSSGPTSTHHVGREFGIVVTGVLDVEIEGVVHTLATGDAIAYSSTRPHRISNPGTGPARAVWINIDPR